MSKVKSIICNLFYFKIYVIVLMFLKANLFINSLPATDVLTILSALWGAFILLYDTLHERNFMSQKYFKCFALFLISYCVSVALNYKLALTDNIQDIIWFLVSVTVIMMPTGIKDSEKSHKDFIKLLYVYIGCSFVFAFVSLFFVFFNAGALGEYGAWGFFLNRLYGIYRSPNYGAVYCVISLDIAVYLLKRGADSKKIKWSLIINGIVQFLYIVYSGSNTGKVCLIMMLLVYFLRDVFFAAGFGKKALKMFIMVCAIMAAFLSVEAIKMGTVKVMALVDSVKEESAQTRDYDTQSVQSTAGNSEEDGAETEQTESRTGEESENTEETVSSDETDTESNTSNSTAANPGGSFSLDRLDMHENTQAGNGRVYIWTVALKVFRDYPLFGTTMRAYKTIVRGYDNSFRSQLRDATLENDFMSLLVCTGIAGTVIMLFTAVWIIRDAFKIGRRLFKNDKDDFEIFWTALSVVCIVCASMIATDAVIFANALQAVMFWIALGICVNSFETETEKE